MPYGREYEVRGRGVCLCRGRVCPSVLLPTVHLPSDCQQQCDAQPGCFAWMTSSTCRLFLDVPDAAEHRSAQLQRAIDAESSAIGTDRRDLGWALAWRNFDCNVLKISATPMISVRTSDAQQPTSTSANNLQNCTGTWMEWTDCDGSVSIRSRAYFSATMSSSAQSRPGAIAGGARHDAEEMRVGEPSTYRGRSADERAAASGACPLPDGFVQFGEPCAVDCLGRFGPWTGCQALKGSSGDHFSVFQAIGIGEATSSSKRTRVYYQQVPATNGGAACPHPHKYVQEKAYADNGHCDTEPWIADNEWAVVLPCVFLVAYLVRRLRCCSRLGTALKKANEIKFSTTAPLSADVGACTTNSGAFRIDDVDVECGYNDDAEKMTSDTQGTGRHKNFGHSKGKQTKPRADSSSSDSKDWVATTTAPASPTSSSRSNLHPAPPSPSSSLYSDGGGRYGSVLPFSPDSNTFYGRAGGRRGDVDEESIQEVNPPRKLKQLELPMPKPKAKPRQSAGTRRIAPEEAEHRDSDGSRGQGSGAFARGHIPTKSTAPAPGPVCDGI